MPMELQPGKMQSPEAKNLTDETPPVVIGIGASAGGLAPLETFFSHMPSDGEIAAAFVIVQHLDPNHESILSELMRRCTRMPVFDITDGIKVEANCVYVTRPNKELSVSKGRIQLSSPTLARGLRLPIDFFFRSMASSLAERAICIILSGNGTDGTLGLRAIKEAGGMAMVQDPESAEFEGMPRSAISSGLADYVLPPEEMPAQLAAYLKRASGCTVSPTAAGLEVSTWLLKIMALLRTHNGHDLSHYRQNTIRRRVERRMVVNQVDSLESYVRLLRQNPSELDILFRELLIGVTSFFRDPPAFDAVRDQALLPLMSERPSGLPLRLWVPACSTGEEAYSLAMLLHEAAEKLGREFVVQIFATDIDHDSIERARAGVYPASIAADVSPERLTRFFVQEQSDFYRIKKGLRDQLIFAEQDIIKDPPFSKLDFISCRNMLIYMEPLLQKRLMPLFHYALAPGGFVLLGNSESVGEFSNLFTTIDRKWKLYRRKDLVARPIISWTMSRVPAHSERPAPTGPAPERTERKPPLREMTERMLLRNYAPACVAVNEQGEILYVHGRSGKYLELPAGEASLNVLRAARDGLKVELANALRKVVAHRQPVHYEGLEVRTESGFQKVNVVVELVEGANPASPVIIMTFQDYPPKPVIEMTPPPSSAVPEKGISPDEKDHYIATIERELRIKTDTLQTTVDELETSNEELKSTNEELQSTNEELQSTNEELETSKEELQSVNEELVTVNTELQQKIEGLSRANNDMNNLLAGTGIGMLFVDHQLCIQRFTPAATQIIKLIQTDIGRPVSDLVSNLANYDHLGEQVKKVLDNLIPTEAEVRTRDGRWYLLRILPYRTTENMIEGAVLTFVEIGAQKRAEAQFRALSAELEQRVQERTSELERVNQSLEQEILRQQKAEARHMANIAELAALPDVSARIANETDSQKLLQATLEMVMKLSEAEAGLLQVPQKNSETLVLLAHQGAPAPLLEQLDAVTTHRLAFSGDSLRRGERLVVHEINSNPLFAGAPALEILRAAGLRALESIPVLASDGQLLGLFSIYWSKPPTVDPGKARLLDFVLRQTADLLEFQDQRGLGRG
jgi:two-component system CheB/CheR fusion protein